MITKMVRCVTAKGTEIRLATPQSPLSLSHTHAHVPSSYLSCVRLCDGTFFISSVRAEACRQKNKKGTDAVHHHHHRRDGSSRRNIHASLARPLDERRKSITKKPRGEMAVPMSRVAKKKNAWHRLASRELKQPS